jgi:hypothetical protein
MEACLIKNIEGKQSRKSSVRCFFEKLSKDLQPSLSALLHTYIPFTLNPQRGNIYSSEMPRFYQNYLTMTDTADVTGCKPIAV